MIKQAGSEAIFIKADVSQADDVKNMVKTTVDTYGRLDILYNNATIFDERDTTVDCMEEHFEKVIAINLEGVWLGMKYAIPEMLKSGGGSIINTGSQAALRGVANIPAYTAAKGRVLALSRATAIEFATQNIRGNSINPGTINTPMCAGMDPKFVKQFRAAIPMGRFGEPEEVAQLALFLASDASSFITGQYVNIDGGMTSRVP